MEMGFVVQALSDSGKVSPLMRYRPCESRILIIILTQWWSNYFAHATVDQNSHAHFIHAADQNESKCHP